MNPKKDYGFAIQSFVNWFWLENGRYPSVRILAKELGLNSPGTVSVHIKRAIDEGLVSKDDQGHLIPMK